MKRLLPLIVVVTTAVVVVLVALILVGPDVPRRTHLIPDPDGWGIYVISEGEEIYLPNCRTAPYASQSECRTPEVGDEP